MMKTSFLRVLLKSLATATDRRSRSLLLGCLVLFGLTASVCGSPSGLNNIPTADTPAHREGVFQWYGNFPEHGEADLLAGFKTGFDLQGRKYRLEAGLDFTVSSADIGPIVFQMKAVAQPYEGLPALALGAANVALTEDDRDTAGQPFSYAVLTHDFAYFRAHAGYGIQQDNNTILLGLDKTIKFLDRDLMLRTDLRQFEDTSRWLASVGFLYALHPNIVLESWASQPDGNRSAIFTAKLNFVFHY